MFSSVFLSLVLFFKTNIELKSFVCYDLTNLMVLDPGFTIAVLFLRLSFIRQISLLFPPTHLLKPTLWSWVARAGFPETQHTPRLSPQLAMITYFSAKTEPCKRLLEMKKKNVNESYNHAYVIISYLNAALYLFNLKWGHPLLWSPTCLLQRQPDQIVAGTQKL